MRSCDQEGQVLARIPCRLISVTSTQGSFDSAASSLREEATPLKMTGVGIRDEEA
jgi:hypothetical protein